MTTPSTPSKAELTKAQRVVLWHMDNGWTLLVGNTGRLVLCGPKFEIKPVRRATRKVVMDRGFIKVARTSDISYALTETGRQIASTITTEDFE